MNFFWSSLTTADNSAAATVNNLYMHFCHIPIYQPTHYTPTLSVLPLYSYLLKHIDTFKVKLSTPQEACKNNNSSHLKGLPIWSWNVL